MGVGTLIPVEEYLRTSYHPDREYRDGVVVERNVGNQSHAALQIAIGHYLQSRRKQWGIAPYTELRIKAREGWYPIPDLSVCLLPKPAGEVPDRPPFLWIEILSPEDTTLSVSEKAREAVACGTPYVWVINPMTLDSDLWSARGRVAIADQTLRLPDSPIVIPLRDAMEE